MKTIQHLFFVAMATLLMAADCSNKDSEFYNDVFVSKPGLVTLENTSSSSLSWYKFRFFSSIFLIGCETALTC